jgi:serine/alanine adding enzyme
VSIKIVRSLPVPTWNGFVANHPEGTIFHTPEMFEVFSRTRGHRPQLRAATDGNRVLALLLPIQIAFGGRMLQFLTTRAVSYGSALYEPTTEGIEALGLLLRNYVDEIDGRVLFTELRNLSDLTQIQPVFLDHGFWYEDHLNYLISLDQPLHELFLEIGRRTRKQIRHGIRSGDVVIEEAATREQIETCYRLLKQTYASARVPLADRSLFTAAFDVLAPIGMVKFPMAWVGEACVAASVELVYRDTIYGWYGGVDRRYVSYTPNELLMWHILKWGAESGYRTYDFGGAGKPDEEYGVRTFKAKFGGRLVCFGRNVCNHAPRRLAVSKGGYAIYQRAWELGTLIRDSVARAIPTRGDAVFRPRRARMTSNGAFHEG